MEKAVKQQIVSMTNRELFTEYEQKKHDERYFLIQQEMAKRLGQTMVLSSTVPLFKQYKLNGAGDERR